MTDPVVSLSSPAPESDPTPARPDPVAATAAARADRPLSAHLRRRFYKTVDLQPDTAGARLVLDGRPVQTPGRRPLCLPYPALAQAVAAEWAAQGDLLRPDTMPMTQLANTALDRVVPAPGPVIEALVAYGGSDLLCYRVSDPVGLAERQARSWQPVLDWLADRHGVSLLVTEGVMPVTQPAAALDRLGGVVASVDPWVLTGVQAATAAAGSLALALAIADRRLTGEEAADLAHLDETWQEDHWGVVAEAMDRRRRIAADLAAADRFIHLVTT